MENNESTLKHIQDLLPNHGCTRLYFKNRYRIHWEFHSETIGKQYKGQDWEKLKCYDAVFLWKDVTNVELELKLMENYIVLRKNQKHYDNS
ncbi:hypothetical protein Glove_132g22 [Diversispora epigaea]|uniref:Uncharacterized protein n=1 Tax=Diversispora epigaea TaxID=1348612 RepID=A0A397IXL2_9GLOM|nr:hypothetical protein Glove_132g22 [Diversispora epigaea]